MLKFPLNLCKATNAEFFMGAPNSLGLRLRAKGSGFRVKGSECRVWGLDACTISGEEFASYLAQLTADSP